MIAWRLTGSSRASWVALASPREPISSSTSRRVASESAANTWSAAISRRRRARASAASASVELAQRARLDHPDAGPVGLGLEIDLDPARLLARGRPPEDESARLVDLLDESVALVDPQVPARHELELGVLAGQPLAELVGIGDRLPGLLGEAGTRTSALGFVHAAAS